MAGDLPNELINEILLRLPSKSLLRFRSVCKSWRSLISSTEFRLTHTHNFNNRNPRMLVRQLRANKEVYGVHFDDDDFSVDYGTPIEFPFGNRDFILFYRIIGCCNGVVCLSDDINRYRKDKVILWNPSIRKKLTLTPPMHRARYWRDMYLVFGFGYDRVSDDYKVVRLAYDGWIAIRPQVEVYTVRTADWRAIEFPHDLLSYNIFPKWSHVFLNGSSHWVSSHWVSFNCTPGVKYYSILTFDISTEHFGAIQMPEDIVEESATELVVTEVGESLAVIYSSRYRRSYFGPSTYMIWVMKEYKNPASWTMIYNMHYPNTDVGRALGLRNNGDLMTESMYGYLMIHNYGVCHYPYPCCRGPFVADSVFVGRYQESLALLDAGRDVRLVDDGQEEGYGDEWFARYMADKRQQHSYALISAIRLLLRVKFLLSRTHNTKLALTSLSKVESFVINAFYLLPFLIGKQGVTL